MTLIPLRRLAAIHTRAAGSKRLRLFAAAGLLAMLVTVTPTQANDLRERLAACASCHGERGEGVSGTEYTPHLAGKPAGYLFAQLQGFRDGRRVYPQMVWLVQHMDDAYLHEIADYYAAQPPRTAPAEATTLQLSAAARARAEVLVQHGDPGIGLPACAACHGAALTGLEPRIPALVGLPAHYVIAQFGAWTSGVRRGAAPDCMADIAAKLSAADINAVAVWLSQQHHADGERPAAAGSWLPPLHCAELPVAAVQP